MSQIREDGPHRMRHRNGHASIFAWYLLSEDPMGAIRLTFKDVDEVGASDYITSVTISRKQVQ